MRTTITLAPDVVAAAEAMRAERGIGLSDAVNDLVRRGLASGTKRVPFVQETFDMGLLIDISNVEEALDLIEGPDRR
jgi:hypothetical protein